MTPERYIILALLIAVAVLSWIAFGPSPDVPPVDPERYRVEERMKMLESEADALREALEQAKADIDTVEVVRWRNAAKHDSIAKVRMGQGDSIQGVVLKERLSINPPTGDK
jgi:hypothetical protein